MLKIFRKRFYVVAAVWLLVFCCSFFPADWAQAAGATLNLSPGSGTYTVGQSFNVKVAVNSGDSGINAAEGAISFDPNFLNVSKTSDSGSIFELWTTKPTYSNLTGTINFGGGLPSAYTGSAGTIFTITFTAKKSGSAEVKFTSGVILAADGKGTNVFSGFGNGSYTLKDAEQKEEPASRREEPRDQPKEEVKGILPPAPEVDSPTHPQEETWYADNQPEFAWKLLSDITGVNYDITADPMTDPGPKSDGIIESKQFDPVDDGRWYFHIKFQNRVGWGKTTHRPFLVDASPPTLAGLRIDNGGDPTDPTPLLRFTAADATSGIDRYALLINGAPVELKSESFVEEGYVFDPLLPQEHMAEFAVFDKAGNSASTTLRFMVDPLKPPIISDIPKIITTKDELIIRGTTFYPNVTVKIYLAKNGENPEEFQVKADDQGSWNYFHRQKLDKAYYEVWAKVVDERQAQSLNSAKHIITVIAPSLVDAYGWVIIIIFLAVIAAESIYILYLRRRYMEEQARVRREIEEAKVRLGEIFSALREEVDELMELADKRTGLSESERRVKEKLQEALNISQEFLDKEMEDVEKEISRPAKKDESLK